MRIKYYLILNPIVQNLAHGKDQADINNKREWCSSFQIVFQISPKLYKIYILLIIVGIQFCSLYFFLSVICLFSNYYFIRYPMCWISFHNNNVV